MKSQVHPAVVIAIIAVVLGVAIFFVYKGSGGVNGGDGKLKSDLNMDGAMKKAEQDPEAFKKAIQDSAKKGGMIKPEGTGP